MNGRVVMRHVLLILSITLSTLGNASTQSTTVASMTDATSESTVETATITTDSNMMTEEVVTETVDDTMTMESTTAANSNEMTNEIATETVDDTMTMESTTAAYSNKMTNEIATETSDDTMTMESTTAAYSSNMMETSESNAPNEPIPAPENFIATGISSDSITYRWDAVTSPRLASYELKYNTNKTEVDKDSTSYNLTGLTPCTTYMSTIRVKSTEAGKFGLESDPVTVRTLAAADSGKVTVTTKNFRSTQVQLIFTEESSVKSSCGQYSYKIIVSYTNGTILTQFITNQRTYLLRNLIPQTSYRVESSIIETISRAEGPKSVSTFETMAAETVNIAAPTNVIASSVTGNSMTIAWIAPSEVTGYAIVDYEVSFAKTGSEPMLNKTGSTRTRYSLEKLESCTVYFIVVRAIAQEIANPNNTVNGQFSNQIQVRTKAGDVAPVSNATVKFLNSATVEITIIDLVERPRCGDYWYAVTVRTEDRRVVASMNVKSKVIIFGSLEPSTKYTAEIVVQDKSTNTFSESFDGLSFEITAAESPCSDQTKMNFRSTQVTQNTVSLAWTQPELRGGRVIAGYSLRISYGTEERERRINGNETLQLTEFNLKPCTMYTFALTPFDTRNVSCHPINLRVMTLPVQPSPVAEVTASSPNSNQINVKITPSVTTTTCTEIVYEISLIQGDKEVDIVNTESTSYLLTSGIEASKDYTVSVKATYPAFKLKSSARTTKVTTPAASSDRPNPPSNVRVTETRPDSVKITWVAPTTDKTGYIIFYTSGRDSNIANVNDMDATSAMIFGLDPCTVYNITMRTKLKKDGMELISGPSNQISATTDRPNPPVPNSVSLVQVSGSDTALKLIVSDESEVKCGSIIVYDAELFEQKFGRTSRLRKVQTANKSVEFTDLTPGFRYLAAVASIDNVTSRRSAVVRSAPTFLPPKGKAPEKPTGVKNKDVTSRKATVEWDAPANSSTVGSYILIYTDSFGFAKTQTVPSANTSSQLNALFPCTKYKAQLQALSPSTPPIPSELSDTTEFTTAAEVEKVTRVVLRQQSNSSAEIFIVGRIPICESQYKIRLNRTEPDQNIWERMYDTKPKTIDGLEVGLTYYVEVSVVSGDEESDPVRSNQVTISSTDTPQQLPTSRLNLQAPIAGPDGTNLDYTPDLGNKSSPQYTSMQQSFCDAMATFIGNSGDPLTVSNCTVESFNPGSVIADAEIAVAEVAPRQSTAALNITNVLTRGIQASRSDQVGIFLDTAAISVTNLTTTVILPPVGATASSAPLGHAVVSLAILVLSQIV